MYMLSKATLKMIDAGKRKWNTTGHDCEAYLEKDSIVRAPRHPCRAAADGILTDVSFLTYVASALCGRLAWLMSLCSECEIE